MYIGTLYNVLVCFIAGLSGILVFFKLQALREEEEQRYSRGLDYFLLSFGVLWILVGVRNFFFWAGYGALDTLIWKWIVGPLTYLHLLPLFYFYGWSFFDRHRALYVLFVGTFTVITFFTVGVFFAYGFELSEMTYWGTKYDANPLTHSIFTYGIFIPALFCVFFDVLRRFKAWKEKKFFANKRLFAFNIGLLIYALVAVFDGLAIARGETLLLVRIGIMVSALIIYFFATGTELDEE